MSDKNNTLEKFNSVLLQFINSLSESFPKIPKKINNITDDSYLLEFIENITKHHNLLTEKNIVLFEKELIKDLPLKKLKNYDLSDTNLKVIWKYLNILYIYGFNYTKDKNLSEILNSFKNTNNSDNLDGATQTFLNIIEMMKNNKSDDNTIDENTNIDAQLSENIFGGSIGKLAFDIAKDINVSDFETEDPTQMLTSLMSGNIDPNSKLMKLFENVTHKINEKITSGNIDSKLLEKEASNMLSGSSGGLDLSAISSIMQKNLNSLNQSNTESLSRKEKKRQNLRKKLKERRMKKNKNL